MRTGVGEEDERHGDGLLYTGASRRFDQPKKGKANGSQEQVQVPVVEMRRNANFSKIS